MKKLLHVRIDEDIYETLKLLAEKNRSTISEEVRRILLEKVTQIVRGEKSK